MRWIKDVILYFRLRRAVGGHDELARIARNAQRAMEEEQDGENDETR